MKSFEKSVSVLISAYLKGTLMHGRCTKCAVGNLIANAMGLKVTSDSYYWQNENGCDIESEWEMVFVTPGPGLSQDVYPNCYAGEAKIQIDSTGYDWRDLAKIECAFEKAKGKNKDERMFNGLVKVFEALSEIHAVDLSVKEEALQALQSAK